MVNNVKIKSALARFIESLFTAHKVILAARHYPQSGIGSVNNTVKVVHLNIGFNGHLVLARNFTHCGFGQSIDPLVFILNGHKVARFFVDFQKRRFIDRNTAVNRLGFFFQQLYLNFNSVQLFCLTLDIGVGSVAYAFQNFLFCRLQGRKNFIVFINRTLSIFKSLDQSFGPFGQGQNFGLDRIFRIEGQFGFEFTYTSLQHSVFGRFSLNFTFK